MYTIFNNLQQKFKEGTILNKLIYINVGVFLLLSVLNVISFMFQFDLNSLLNTLFLPADKNKLISQPWTFITYMFLHLGFLHLLMNMLWLHFGGEIFLKYLNPKQLLGTYILGGISGGILFIIAYNYVPALKPYVSIAQALGASASVLAIIISIATYAPNHSVQFPFIGFIKLKHIAIFSVILDIISIPKGNAGGHIAHIGGAIFGYLYITQLKKGNDISTNFSNFLNKLANTFKRKRKLKTVYKRQKSDYDFNAEKTAKKKEIDKILEKIAQSGYESLSKEEKAILFSASKK